MALLFPSLISGDLLALREQIKFLDQYVDGYHLDVMDHHFVPNLTWGSAFVNAIAKVTQKQLHIHLMVNYPEIYFKEFKLRDNDIVSIHYESRSNLPIDELLFLTKQQGWIASVAINPETPVSVLKEINGYSHVILMTVHPGFSGQQFLPTMREKLALLLRQKHEAGLTYTLAADGGITLENAQDLIHLGVQQLAVASALFNAPDLKTALQEFKKIVSG